MLCYDCAAEGDAVAIVECPACGNAKSNQAPTCANCGAAPSKSVLVTVLDALLYGALLAIVCFLIARYA